MAAEQKSFAKKWLWAVSLAVTSTSALAQDVGDLKKPRSPLVLKERGSFYVGGEVVAQTATEVGFASLFPYPDMVTINQMYVDYMIPQSVKGVPVVMLHGATLTGKTYDTTPDGRMGWFEYFVREGFPVYQPDQVGRGRSGFNQAVFNNVGAGLVPPASQPALFRLADKYGSWVNLRFGPSPGVAYPNQLFPVEFAHEFSKQDVPDPSNGLPSPNPTIKNMSDLSKKLGGAILMGHSQGARIPSPAALVDIESVKGLIIIEPSNCTRPQGTTYTDADYAKLAKIPILVMFGDNLAFSGIGTNWQTSFDDCQTFVSRVKSAGGNAQMLWPPNLGIRGNSHMIMQDKNNAQIADLIIKWIDKNVKYKKDRFADKR